MDDSLITRISTSESNFTLTDKSQTELDEKESILSSDKLAAPIAQILREIILENNGKKMNLKVSSLSLNSEKSISECSSSSSSPDSLPLTPDCFHAKKVPSMSLEDYLKRIIKYSQVEPSSLITAVIYIDQIYGEKKYMLNVNNIHRFLLASIVVSIKFNEDDFYKNTQYAKIGGISLVEMNKLEYEFFILADFSLYISDNLYQKYENYFEQLIKTKK